MRLIVRWIAVLGCLLCSWLGADAAIAQKSGGVLKIYHRDSPASMSILEEGTNSTEIPMMGVFNNLAMYDQHVAQNSLSSIVPDLATDWSTSEDGTRLIFHLREGVKWHDGLPFTAADVKCTWDLLTGKASEKLRLNPRKAWYNNIEEITTNGDHEATFVLKQPQPWLIALLASGYAPVYPCHVSPRDMRTHPIGTGPFKFIEFKPNERAASQRASQKPSRPASKPSAIRVIVRPALTASARLRCSRPSSRSGLGSSFLRADAQCREACRQPASSTGSSR